jgi:4'-phosphopantetheinyl transferase
LALDDQALATERQLLTIPERAHADRGTAVVARRRTALRAGLRRLAGEALGLPPTMVPIRTGEHGRPELDLLGVDVSCSRSGNLGLVAVSFGMRIGIDIERITPWHDDLLTETWLTDAERRALGALDPIAAAVAAARCWTRKEAVLKGIGSGLTGEMAGLETGVEDGPAVVAGWHLSTVRVPSKHVATVATLAQAAPAAVPHSAASAAAERSLHGLVVS